MSTFTSPPNLPAKQPGRFPFARQTFSGQKAALVLAFLALGLGLSVATAYLVVKGRWEILVGLLILLPAVALLHRYPFLAIMMWLALTPFLIITPNAALRNLFWMVHRALPLLTVIIIVVSHALQINKRPLPRLGWIELAMAGYVGISLVSIITLNADPQATVFQFYDRVFIPMCLYLIVRLSMPDEQDLQRLVPVVFFLCLSQSIFGLLSWAAPHLLPHDWLDLAGERTTGSLSSYSVYTTTLIFSGLFLLHAALQRKPGLLRTLYLATFILALFCVFLSFSRGSWLAGLMVVTGLFFIYPKFMLRLSLIAVPVMLLLGSGPLAKQIEFANARLNTSQTALSRLPVFQAALGMFEVKPLFGWGYGNFDRFDRRYQARVGNLVSPEKDRASHNVYLTLISEQGALGLLLFLAPVVGWLILSFRAWPRMPAEGFWSRKLLVILWLVILDHVVVNSFSNMRIVFGLGMWWITLGLIGHLVYTQLALGSRPLPVWMRRAVARPRVSVEPNLSSEYP